MINRDTKTGRFVSDNPDPMTKAMIEKYQNSRGMRILREMIEIDRKQRAEASKHE
mgnify:FL=1